MYVFTKIKNVSNYLYIFNFLSQVRTKDRVFESVPHLIKYHCTNELPIVSADSALLLRKPVLRAGAS